MLYRDDPGGPIAITQPAHAHVAGQLARAWGHPRFGKPEPWDEVCVAADRHDDGWLGWEADPELDHATGRPYSFRDLPRAAHLAIWSKAARSVLALGRYPALLVSLHGTGLYERHDREKDAAADDAIEAFLSEQYALQATLIAVLQADQLFASYVAPAAIARNRRLIAIWDILSLAICGGRRESLRLDRVPASAGETSLLLTPVNALATRFTMAPWPFAADRVSLCCEGRQLVDRYSDEAAMRAGLATAPWVTVEVELQAGAEN